MINNVKCPKCQTTFEVSEALTQELQEQLQSEYSKKEAEFKRHLAKRESELNAKLVEQAESMEKELLERLRVEKVKIQATVAETVKAEAKEELADLQEQLREKEAKLASAAAKELDLRKQQRVLESAKQEFELNMARKLDEERVRIKEELGTRLNEDHNFQKLEWQKKQSDMEKLIADLKQKAEQGSQQAQGEVLELEVEAILQEAFKHDSIEPVAKGIKGGDVLHRVMTRTGQSAGTILWETKRTKSFNDGWIPKLKDDQRAAKAEVAVIVTTSLPEGIKHIGHLDGVWIADFQSFVGLALALRASVLEVTQARQAMIGKNEKMESLYSYLSGPEFRGRVEAIVEAFTIMKEDLDAEKRAIEKSWAKREKQITRVIGNTAGMYGELQGIIGATLPEVPALTMETSGNHE